MEKLKPILTGLVFLGLLEFWAACGTTHKYNRVSKLDDNTYAVEMQAMTGCSNNMYLAKCQLNGNQMVCQPGAAQDVGAFGNTGYGPEE